MGLLLSIVRGGSQGRMLGWLASAEGAKPAGWLASAEGAKPAPSRRPVPAFGGDEDELEQGWVDAFVGEEGDDEPQAISLELSCTDAWPSASLRRASLPCRMALPEDTIAAEGWTSSERGSWSDAEPDEGVASEPERR
jgi:hypothetical protein